MLLNKKEIEQMRENAKVHKEVFTELKKVIAPWVTGKQIDKICWDICKKHDMYAWFKWVYDFPANLCLSVNNVVVHGLPRAEIIFQEWDLATFDFWVKDKKYWVNTDAAFSVVVGGDKHNNVAAEMIEVNKKALKAWIKKARAWNRIGDISHAIQKVVDKSPFHIVKELTGHGIGKTLHEKPYVYNYGRAWTGPLIKKGMLLAIEPILWETSWKIVDEWDWEIFIADGSLGCQYEHTILITDDEPEIII